MNTLMNNRINLEKNTVRLSYKPYIWDVISKALDQIKFMNYKQLTTERRSGINPGNPLSMSARLPRKTKLMVAEVYGYSARG